MKMGLSGDITDDASDLAGPVILQFEGLADYIRTVEVFFGRGLVDYEGMGFVESSIGIAGDHWHGEHLEERRVGIDTMVVLYPVVLLFDHDVAKIVETNHLNEVGIVVNKGPGHGPGRHRGGKLGIFEIKIGVDAVDAVRVDIISIVAELVEDI